LLALLALVLFWTASPAIRLYLGLALLMYLVAEGMTFAYFFPRNDILFKTAQLNDLSLLKKTWAEWRGMNFVRTAVLLVGLVFSFLSLHKIYLMQFLQGR